MMGYEFTIGWLGSLGGFFCARKRKNTFLGVGCLFG